MNLDNQTVLSCHKFYYETFIIYFVKQDASNRDGKEQCYLYIYPYGKENRLKMEKSL